MIRNYAYSTKLALVVFTIIACCTGTDVLGQVFNDGPIRVQARLRRFSPSFAQTDAAVFGVVGQPDDLSYNIWGREPVGNGVSWTGGGPGLTCSANGLLEGYNLPFTDWNQVFYNFTYPTTTNGTPLEIRLDAWEDESPDQLLGIGCGGTRCAYDVGFCCGGFLFGLCLGVIDDDDLRCNSGNNTPYATVNYRLGPPCQWFNHGNLNGTCANDVYHPGVETFWRYTRGDGCINAINLGPLAPGFTQITHFNSNECYNNTIAYPPGGNDVTYQINVTQPIGLVVNTCGTGSIPTDVLILNSSCTQIFSNSGFCGNGSQISTPICTPGIYYIVVEGRANALGTFTLQVSENPILLVQANAGPNAAVCQGLGVNIGAQLPQTGATGGLGPYTYLWTPNTFITSTNTPGTIVNPPSTRTYTLTVTDALNCVSIDSMVVTVNPGPIVNLGPDVTVCPGTSIGLDAGSGFGNYFWSTGAFSQTVNVTLPGQYLAVVTDLFGCQGRDTMRLFNHALPAVSLGPDTSICLGQSLPINVANVFPFYNWSTGAISQGISTSSSGTFSVTVVDANSCTNRDTIVVNVDTLPIPILPGIVTKCPGTDAVLNPGAGWPTYLWSTGSINQLIITSVVGPYSVTVTDGNGCVGTTSTNVVETTVPLGFGVTAPANFFCAGTNITLDAGTGPNIVAYYWSNGVTTQTNTVNSSGIYHVTATDIYGCEWADSIQVNAAPLPVVELGPDVTICQGQNTLLSAPQGFSYAWSTGQTQQIISATAAGTYFVTVTNPGTLCASIDSIVVNVLPVATPALPVTVPLCIGEFTTLDPGAGFNSYDWSTGANSQSISVTTPGVYTVTVTNPNGCTSTATTTITNYPAAVAVVSGSNLGCLGTSNQLVATGGFASYAWSNGATTQGILVNGTGTYSVTATNANGCEASASITVTFNPLPVLNLPPIDTVCQYQVVTLDAGAGFSSYIWSQGSTTQTVITGAQGVYSVTVTNSQGCSASGSISVIRSQSAPVDIGDPTAVICDRGELLVLAAPVYVSYSWSTGNVNQFLTITQPGTYNVTATDAWGCVSEDSVIVTAAGLRDLDFMPSTGRTCAGSPYLLDAGSQWGDYQWATGSVDQYLLVTTPGTYFVTVTDLNGCRFFDSTVVSIDTPPALELGANVNICPGEVLTIDAGAGFDTYIWSTGATTQTIQVNAPGNYTVTATFATCTLNDIANVGDDCPGRIFIPNVFSPNADGLNDVFNVTYINLEKLEVKIYDRWGKHLFSSVDKNFRWDGEYNDNPLPEGVYYWTMDYKYTDSEIVETQRGNVTILR
jgi:gliding motility-associated-like protein